MGAKILYTLSEETILGSKSQCVGLIFRYLNSSDCRNSESLMHITVHLGHLKSHGGINTPRVSTFKSPYHPPHIIPMVVAPFDPSVFG